MKKFLNSLFAVLLILGIAGVVTSFSDAMVILKGDTVSLNEATKSDFDKKALIEGDVYYVYDCIAIEEVKNTRYGVTTSTEETNFYLIESYDKSILENDYDDSYVPLTLIYSTANKSEIARLDSMVEDWYAYEEAAYNGEDVDFPEKTFPLVGMITEYDDKELIKYRDEYIAEITEDLDTYLDTYCVDMIIERTSPDSVRNIFFITIGLGVVGLVGLICVFVSSKKKKQSEELY